jgi:hypothetical protein
LGDNFLNFAGDERQRMFAKAEKFIKKANGVKQEEQDEPEIKEEIEEEDGTFVKEEEDAEMDVKEVDFDDSGSSDADISGDARQLEGL